MSSGRRNIFGFTEAEIAEIRAADAALERDREVDRRDYYRQNKERLKKYQREYYRQHREAIIDAKRNARVLHLYAADPEQSPLRKWRRANGYTLKQAASVLGCSMSSLGEYELGIRRVPDWLSDYIKMEKNHEEIKK